MAKFSGFVFVEFMGGDGVSEVPTTGVAGRDLSAEGVEPGDIILATYVLSGVPIMGEGWDTTGWNWDGRDYNQAFLSEVKTAGIIRQMSGENLSLMTFKAVILRP